MHFQRKLHDALEGKSVAARARRAAFDVAAEADAEIARLQAQVADAQWETESLRERLFGALKTDEVLAKALQEVDHAMDLRRSTLSAVMDVACVQKARAESLQAQVDALAKALWVATEHNALHFGEQHNTVIQGRAALAAVGR